MTKPTAEQEVDSAAFAALIMVGILLVFLLFVVLFSVIEDEETTLKGVAPVSYDLEIEELRVSRIQLGPLVTNFHVQLAYFSPAKELLEKDFYAKRLRKFFDAPKGAKPRLKWRAPPGELVEDVEVHLVEGAEDPFPF